MSRNQWDANDSWTNDAAPLQDETGIVEADRRCAMCGRSLRGLNALGRCPQCRTAVGRTLQGNLLRFAEPQYVRRLAGGVNLMLWSLLIALGVAVLAVVLRNAERPSMLPDILSAAGRALALIGAWMLTSPERGRLDAHWQQGLRRFIRVTIVAGLIGAGLALVGGLMVAADPDSPTGIAKGVRLLMIGALAELVGAVGTFALFLFFSRLATRIPAPELAQNTRTVMWLYGLGIGLVAVLAIVSVMSIMTGSAHVAMGGLGLLAIGGCVAGIMVLVGGIWWIVLLFRYRNEFLEQTSLAEQMPHHTPPPPIRAAPRDAPQAPPAVRPASAPVDFGPSL